MSGRRRWLWIVLGACAAALVAVVVVVATGGDDGPPGTLPGEPGRLVSAEAFTRQIPAGARAWRILYTTTGDDGAIVPATGLVVVPAGATAKRPAPVVLWDHGTIGVSGQCTPSLRPQPFGTESEELLTRLLAAGAAMVAPDYPGLGTAAAHEYMVGRPNARASLDAVRAARELDGDRLGDRTVALGYSQGGGVALWTAIFAKDYAPDVELSGVGTLAPASDLFGLAGPLQTTGDGTVFGAYVLAGYGAAYRDVTFDAYVKPEGAERVREIARRCLDEPGFYEGMPNPWDVFTRDLREGPLGTRLKQNVPSAATTIPTFIGQGLDDGVVNAGVQHAFARAICERGTHVQFRTYEGRDHPGIIAADSPALSDLVAWTRERLRGTDQPAASCDF